MPKNKKHRRKQRPRRTKPNRSLDYLRDEYGKVKPTRIAEDKWLRMWDPVYASRPLLTPGVLDAPLRTICINEQWAGAVAALCERLNAPDAWQGVDDEQHDILREVETLLHALEMGSCEGVLETMFRLRENPDDNCEVQQSWDGGETWSTAWRKDNCLPPGLVAFVSTEMGETVEEIEDTWEQNPDDVTPELPPEGTWSPSSKFDDAMCYVIERWIESICQTGIALRNETLEAQGAVHDLVFGFIGFISVILTPITGGTSAAIYAIALAFAYEVGNLTSDFLLDIQASDPAEWGDTEAKEQLRCDAYNRMAGGLPDRATFQNSILPSDYSDGTPEKLIAQLAYDLNQDLDSYLGFIMLLNDAAAIAEQITDFPNCDCPCKADSGDYDWEFGMSCTTINNPAWNIIHGHTVAPPNDCRIIGENEVEPGAPQGTWTAKLELNIPPGAQVNYLYLRLDPRTTAGSYTREQNVLIESAQGVVLDETYYEDAPYPPADIIVSDEVPAWVNLTRIVVTCRGANTAPYIQTFYVRGCGDNPFTT